VLLACAAPPAIVGVLLLRLLERILAEPPTIGPPRT
jgi:hypothetical protein